MQTWVTLRTTMLDEMITLDGPGSSPLDSCGLCGNSQETLLCRCLECSFGLLYCGKCIVKLHIMLPLHRLEVGSLSSTRIPLLIYPVLEGRIL